LIVITKEQDGIFYARQIGEVSLYSFLSGINNSSLNQLNWARTIPEVIEDCVLDVYNKILAVVKESTISPTQQ